MKLLKSCILLSLSGLLLMGNLTSCKKEEKTVIPDQDGWYASWSEAAMATVGEEAPVQGLKNNTVRQQIRPSIGGEKIRLTFSYEYGETPLVLESVHIAKLLYAGSPNIDVATDTVVTFSGSESVTIEPGSRITSDEVMFSYNALDVLAVTSYIGQYTGVTLTVHSDGGCTSWVTTGNEVSAENFSTMSFNSSYYYLCRMDTYAKAGTRALVCIGDSITDGACATYNGFDGWVDVLADKMQSDPATSHISVTNAGIGGNLLLGGTWGEPAKDRFQRDILDVPGIHYAVVMIGINDVGNAQEDISQDIISGYKELIEKAHAKGIKIYGCTLTPVKGNFYYSELHEKIRLSVNEFILSADSGFDGVIDMSMAICREDDFAQMKDEYSCGDYLHPGALGYEAMGNEAYYTLKELWEAEAKAALEADK